MLFVIHRTTYQSNIWDRLRKQATYHIGSQVLCWVDEKVCLYAMFLPLPTKWTCFHPSVRYGRMNFVSSEGLLGLGFKGRRQEQNLAESVSRLFRSWITTRALVWSAWKERNSQAIRLTKLGFERCTRKWASRRRVCGKMWCPLGNAKRAIFRAKKLGFYQGAIFVIQRMFQDLWCCSSCVQIVHVFSDCESNLSLQ